MGKILDRITSPFRRRQHCYCAFCKTPRKVYKKARTSFVHLTLCMLASFGLMLAIWQDFHPMVFIFLVGTLTVTEVAAQLRRRASLICKHCGFDPILYVKDPKKAALFVKEKLETRKNDPRSLLGPALNLPRLRPEKVRSGSQVNRVI